MADFKKLRVWKKAHALALCAHQVALSYHLIIARDINVISEGDFVSVLTPLKEARMMLFGLLKRLDPRTSHPVEPDKTTVVQ